MQEGHDEKARGLTRGGIVNCHCNGDTLAVSLKRVHANWDLAKPQRTLQDINLDIKKGQLCAVIGPVGAGKSSLLQLIFGDLPIADGEAIIHGEFLICRKHNLYLT